MSKHIVTKDSLITMLNDESKRAHVIGRACVALFKRQTAGEQEKNATDTWNYRGFSQSDARTGSLTAKFYMKHKRLEDWQINNWMKEWRGSPRIVKYWKQLDEIARTRVVATQEQ